MMFNLTVRWFSIFFLWMFAYTAQAGLILSLNTGVDNANQLLGDGALEADYTLISSADPGFTLPGNMFVTDTIDGFPFFSGGWISNGPLSNWIVPYTNGQISTSSVSPTGTYIYRTTFDLTGYDPATTTITGRWAVDENGTDILLNGVSTGQTTNNPGFTAFSDFAIASGFVAGVNTLDFVTFQNNQLTGNPIGLRVEGQVIAPNAVPEPSSALLLLAGIGAFAMRKKRSIDLASVV